MKKFAITTLALAGALVLGNTFANTNLATKDEAVAMVKKGIVFIKANGIEKGYAEVSNKAGPFVDQIGRAHV